MGEIGCSFGMFGSSANGFGTQNSDLDILCYWKDASPSSNKELVVAIGVALTKQLGMQDVRMRETARIPLVLFKDPTTGEFSCLLVVN